MPSATNNGITMDVEPLDGAVGVEGTVTGSPDLLNDLGSFGDTFVIEWEPDTGRVGDRIAEQVSGVREDLQPDSVRGQIAAKTVGSHIPSANEIARVGTNQLDPAGDFRYEPSVPSKARVVVAEEGDIHDNVDGVPVAITSYLTGIISESAGDGPTVNVTIPTEAFIEEVPLSSLTDALEIGDIDFPDVIDPLSPPDSLRVPIRNTGDLDTIVEVSAFGYTADVPVPAGTNRTATISGFDLSRPSVGAFSETVEVAVVGDDDPLTETLVADWPSEAADLVVNPPELLSSIPAPGDALSVRIPVVNNGNVPTEATVDLFGDEKTETIDPGETQNFEFGTVPRDTGDFTIQPVVTSPSLDSAISSRKTINIGDGQAPTPEFSLGRPEVPFSLPFPGTSFEVSVPVENIGGSDGTAEVTLLGERRTVTLSPGELRSLDFDITPDSAGSLTIAPRLENVATGASKSTSRTVTIPGEEDDDPEEQESDSASQFTIANVDAPVQVQAGERYEVGLTVKNTGDERGTVTVRVGDRGDEVYKERQYTLSPQGTATFTQGQRKMDAGTYTYTFTVTNADTGNSIVRSIVVPVSEAAPVRPTSGTLAQRSFVLGNANFASRFILRVKSAEIQGDQTVVTATVTNEPYGSGFFSDITVRAEAGGETDSVVVNPGTNQSREVTLNVGRASSATVTMEQTLPSGWTADDYFDGEQPSVTAPVPVAPPEPALFDIIDITFPDVVDIAESYVGEITVENVGEEVGEVSIDGPGLSDSRTLSPGEQATFEAQLENTSPSARFLSYTVENVSEGTQSRIRRTVGTEVADLFLQSLSIPDSVDPESAFPVEVVVGNRGGADGSFDLSVGDVTQSGEVPAGGERSVSVERSLSGFSPSSIPVVLRDSRTGDVVARRTPTVQPNVPSFSLQSVSVPDSVPFGGQGTVTATVQNVGAAAGEYALTLGDTTREGTLSAGDTARVEFPLATDSISATSYSLALRNATLGRDETAQTVEWVTATPSFSIEGADVPRTAAAGERLNIGVNVANNGTTAGEAVVSLAGETATRTIQPNATVTVNIPFQKGDEPVAVLRPSVSWEPVGQMDSTRIRIDSVMPDLTLQSVDAPSEVRRGQMFTVTAVLANDGDAPAPAIINIGGQDRTTTIRPGGSETVRVQIPKGPQASQSVPVSAFIEGMPERSTSRTLTVSAVEDRESPTPQPPSAPSPPVRPGDGDNVPGFVEDFFDFLDGLFEGKN